MKKLIYALIAMSLVVQVQAKYIPLTKEQMQKMSTKDLIKYRENLYEIRKKANEEGDDPVNKLTLSELTSLSSEERKKLIPQMSRKQKEELLAHLTWLRN